MQHTNRQEFLDYVGYGVISLQMMGKLSLVSLTGSKIRSITDKPAGDFAEVEAQAKMLLSGYNVPGIAIGLIRANKLVYARGFGYQNIATRQPMTEYSIMVAASITKTFTGAAIMQLQEAGLLNLDDAFIEHVPYFRMSDQRYKDITIRHLLAHTSGLPEVGPEDFLSPWTNPYSGEDAAERLVRSLDNGLMLRQDPGGSEYIYSGVGYGILAAVIQELTGEVYENYQRKHILEPLQMYNSTFFADEVKPWCLASPHIRDTSGRPIVSKLYPYSRQHTPDCCLFTNIVDLSHWIMANINNGSYYNRILQPETHALLWEPLCDEPWGWPGVSYNSGFWLMNFAESKIGIVRMILMAGSVQGFSTHATIFPDQGIASMVFINLKATPSDPSYSWGICDSLAFQMLRGEL